MKLLLQAFGGIAPSVNPRYLKDSAAQTALDISVAYGTLRPIADLNDTGYTDVGGVGTQTIYPVRMESGSPVWLAWDEPVDVVRSQIAGDTYEWTHYTTADGPVSVFYDAGAVSAPLPMGLPSPAAAPTVVVTGTAEGVPETRYYVYTYIRDIGKHLVAESAPSAAASATVYPGQSVSVTIPAFADAGDYSITHVRLYRTAGGTYLYTDNQWAFTGASITQTDASNADSLNEELPSLLWAPPVSTLTGLTNMPNGIVAGFSGRDVYFSEPYKPYAWPVTYSQSLDHPVVGLGVIDTTLVALTTGVPFFLQGAHPDSIVVVKGQVEQACVSKRSIVSAAGSVIYASPDGLVSLSPSGADVLTQNVFTKEQWRSLNPSSMHAYQHDLTYIAFYSTTNPPTQGALLYDIRSSQFSFASIYAACGFASLTADMLFLKQADSTTLKAWAEGATRTGVWKSKQFTLPRISGFSLCRVEAEGYPITARIYADGVLVHTQTITSRKAFRLPAVTARDWEIELDLAYEVFLVALAQAGDEVVTSG